jgi:UDP-2,3-diacylglucosamine pyrophosphatase LpxH
MGVWSRWFKRGVTPASGDGEENLIVISDVHLGEDIVIEGPDHLSDYIRALNRELAAFVSHYRRHQVDGRRWHLLINGDMFDFVKVSVRPEPGGDSVDRVGAAESVPNTAENVVWKLERIIEVHRPLFKELASFLLDGHRITIVEGNHDAEFYFPEVQEALRQNLARLAGQQHRRERRDGEFDADAVAAGLAFREWFEANPGRFHIEHGHQYDEFCSFEYQLAPYDAEGAPVLATPLSHKAAPYFRHHSADLTAVGLEDTGLCFWVRWAVSQGPRVLWALTRAYWRMVFELVGKVGPQRRMEREGLRSKHLARLRAMSEHAPYGYKTLEQLDRLKATPAEYSRLKMYHGSYVDRFLVGTLVLLAAVPSLFFSWSTAMLWVSADVLAGAGALWLLSRLGRMDVAGSLHKAAGEIASLTGARYVIFGHSHRPELTPLPVGRYGESSFYVNTGSWITREVLLGRAGRGMSYAEITADGASLCRWLGEDQEPVVLAASDAGAMAEMESGDEPHE